MDAFVVGDGGSQTWTNDGTGVFKTDLTLGGGPGLGVALGDVDGDGDTDAFVASPRGGRIWLNGEPNLLPVMFCQIDLEPDPWGELVYNWWGRGNAIVPFRLSQAADMQVSAPIIGRYSLDGDLEQSPWGAVTFAPGTTWATATLWPSEVGGRQGEIWNVYQGAEEIAQDRVRYTLIFSNITAGVVMNGPSTFLMDIRNPDWGNRQCVLDGIWALTKAAGNRTANGSLRSISTHDVEKHDTESDLALPTYRVFRDQILAQSPQGRYFIDLYRRVSPELLQTVSDQAWLLHRSVNVVGQWAPAFQALAEGRGADVTVTPEMLAAGMDYLDALRGVVSPELEVILRAEEEALAPSSWLGMTMDEALDHVQSRKIPPAFTRLRVLKAGDEFVLRWWGEVGQSYRVQRSVTGPQAFDTESDWLPGSRAEISFPLSTAPGTSSLYRLEIEEIQP